VLTGSAALRRSPILTSLPELPVLLLRSRCMENEDIIEPPADETGIEEELLIEEISIDGMCGVY
jgi:mycofactocin precursor